MSAHLLNLARLVFPKINKTAPGEKKIYRVAKESKIRFYHLPLKADGYFLPKGSTPAAKKDSIYLKHGLATAAEIFSTAHEIIHFVLKHNDRPNMFKKTEHENEEEEKIYLSDEQEREARFMTAILLLPYPDFIKCQQTPYDEWSETAQLAYNDRKEALEKWRV